MGEFYQRGVEMVISTHRMWLGLLLLTFAVRCQGYRQLFATTSESRLVDCTPAITSKSYTEWVNTIGQAKTDLLVSGVGLNTLNEISSGVCFSYAIQFFNSLADAGKFVTLSNTLNDNNKTIGLLKSFSDIRNGTTTDDFAAFLNNTPTSAMIRFTQFVESLRAPAPLNNRIYPSADYDLFAQLLAPYRSGGISTNSGIGYDQMNLLFGNFATTNGQNYTSLPSLTGGALVGGGGAGASATVVTSVGQVTKVTITAEGTNCTSISGVSLSGGGGSGASVIMSIQPVAGNDTYVKLKSLYVVDGGSGYATAPTINFTASCGSPPTASATINGLAGWTITAPGSGYVDTFTLSAPNITGGGGSGASGTVLVAGPLASGLTGLASYYGGSGYVSGQTCPIHGGNGQGATCLVTASSGSLTNCSVTNGGQDYIDGTIVTIGGAATAIAIVSDSTVISDFIITNTGCGYLSPPKVSVLTGPNECTTAGVYTAILTAGQITGIQINSPATGCPRNPTVVIGETPYATHSDAATAIVNQVTNGVVKAISMSAGADNFTQFWANQEKAPLHKAATYAASAPNISAREAIVRFLFHGVNHVSSGYVPFFAINNVNYPGIGADHMAKNICANLSGAGSINSLINLLNDDTTDITDSIVLIGCGDRAEFAKPDTFPVMTQNDFHFFCSNHTPTLW